MVHRFPWISVLLLGLLPLGAEGGGTVAAKPERPNILFRFADDWGRQASIYVEADGPDGVNDAVRTPQFDRLARRGVLFRNAFVNAPSCIPCRSALLSGQYFWRTGRAADRRRAVFRNAAHGRPHSQGRPIT